MKKIIFVFTDLTLITLGCRATVSKNTKKIELQFEAKSQSNSKGSATFEETNGEVKLVAKLSGLKPGVHAIHIHEKADCSAADGSSAGGHWNPTFKKHGKWGQSECHKGDIGNFVADEAGNGSIEFSTNEWCIGCEDETKNILNKGLIVHANPDDFVTQPTGNAGGRIACSGIIK